VGATRSKIEASKAGMERVRKELAVLESSRNIRACRAFEGIFSS